MAKVAILEDDKLLLKALEIELKTSGFEVISSADGDKGIELIRAEMPDIIILDVVMPNKNGFEVMEELQSDETLKAIPVIFLTNLGQDEEKEKGMQMGAAGYYVKSNTDLSGLKDKINAVFAKGSEQKAA